MTRPKERIPDLADCHTTLSVLQVVYDVGQRAWHNDQPLPGGLFLLAADKRIEEMAKEDAEDGKETPSPIIEKAMAWMLQNAARRRQEEG
jgi:hypothetical protein